MCLVMGNVYNPTIQERIHDALEMASVDLCVECSCSSCIQKNGAACLQPFFKTGLEHNVIARNSGVHGIGLFARKQLGVKDIICLYSGDLVSKPTESAFIAEVSAGERTMYIDSRDTQNFSGRWINHSIEPNARLIQSWEGMLQYKGKHAILVECIRNIERGDEIFIDYGIEYFINGGVLDYDSYFGSDEKRKTM